MQRWKTARRTASWNSGRQNQCESLLTAQTGHISFIRIYWWRELIYVLNALFSVWRYSNESTEHSQSRNLSPAFQRRRKQQCGKHEHRDTKANAYRLRKIKRVGFNRDIYWRRLFGDYVWPARLSKDVKGYWTRIYRLRHHQRPVTFRPKLCENRLLHRRILSGAWGSLYCRKRQRGYHEGR